jgi:lipopolysaccharide cholinephosphotransferase
MTSSPLAGGAPTIDSPAALHRQLRDMLAVVADILEAASVRYFVCAGTALGARRGGDLIPWDFDVDLLVPIQDYDQALVALRRELPPRYALADPRSDRRYEHLFGRVHLSAIHHKFVHVDLFPLGGTFDSRRAQHTHLVVSKWLRKAFYRRTRALTPRGLAKQSRLVRLAAPILARGLPRSLLIWAFDRVCHLRNPLTAAYLTNLTAGYLEREAVPRTMFDEPTEVSVAGRSYPCPSPPDEYLRSLYGAFEEEPSSEEQRRQLAFFDEWFLPSLRSVPLDVGS